jgi:hypothetical protein
MKRPASNLWAALAMCALAGCTQWPQEGAGGFAERSSAQNPRVQHLGTRYVNALAGGARRHAASDVAEAELLLTRISREYASGLGEDADRDAETLGLVLDRVETRVRVAGLNSK